MGLDEFDRMLIKSLKITYVAGKGNRHLLPLLIPTDTIAALDMLANHQCRQQAGVRDDNDYLFANTK